MPIDRILKLTPLARADLEEIWLYTFTTWSVEQADKYQDELYTGFSQVVANPMIGKSIDYIMPGYYRYKINSHYVFYKILPAEIIVMRVLHERMDMPQHL